MNVLKNELRSGGPFFKEKCKMLPEKEYDIRKCLPG